MKGDRWKTARLAELNLGLPPSVDIMENYGKPEVPLDCCVGEAGGETRCLMHILLCGCEFLFMVYMQSLIVDERTTLRKT